MFAGRGIGIKCTLKPNRLSLKILAFGIIFALSTYSEKCKVECHYYFHYNVMKIRLYEAFHNKFQNKSHVLRWSYLEQMLGCRGNAWMIMEKVHNAAKILSPGHT